MLQIHGRRSPILVNNFIHADMHPENILVRVARNKSSRKRLFKLKSRVIFLDVGMTAELSGSDRVNLVNFFKVVACQDGCTAAECTLILSKQQNCPKPEAIIKVSSCCTSDDSVINQSGSTSRRQILSCLPDIVAVINNIFQCADRSSITKEELV